MKKIVDFEVREKRQLNDDTILLTLFADDLPEIHPGQFVNVRIDHSPGTLLRRPLSVHDVDPELGLLYLFVKIVGDGTAALSELHPGKKLNIILPLGNRFEIPESGSCLLVGGGCGIAPLLYLAKKMNAKGIKPVILFGTRTQKDVLRKEEYEKYGEVYYTTEDGSFGEKGYPTQHTVLQNRYDRIYCCGPEAMMKAVARYAKQSNSECFVSLENTMACGIGACLCCVTETIEGHKCVCTEGPVFNINELTWQI